MRISDWSSDVCSSDLRLAEPGLFDASQQRQIEAGAAAELVRLAPMPSRNEAERFVVADRAIARLDTLIARWRHEGDGGPADIRRARLDRILAYHARFRIRAAVDRNTVRWGKEVYGAGD